jgi:hypothetical protein
MLLASGLYDGPIIRPEVLLSVACPVSDREAPCREDTARNRVDVPQGKNSIRSRFNEVKLSVNHSYFFIFVDGFRLTA